MNSQCLKCFVLPPSSRVPLLVRVCVGTAVAFMLLPLDHAASVAQEWNVAGSGNWFTATNWTPSGIPSAALAARINNGGTATATAGGPVTALLIDAGKNGGEGHLELRNVGIQVQGSLDVGDVESIFATGPVNVTSSGSVSIRDAADVQLGLAGSGDLNVGQTSAANGAIAHGTATLVLDTIGNLTFPGDLDLGQTSGSGRATGNGSAELLDIAGLLSIGGDVDVGQTSGSLGGINAGSGNLMIDTVNEMIVGADVDIGQTTGDGQSTGSGIASLKNVDILTIVDSLDVAKVRAFTTAGNIGMGDITIDGSTASIGFGLTGLGTGSIEIGRVLVSEAALGQGSGVVRLVNCNVDIANDVIVAELALGGTNPNNFAEARLEVTDSKVDTRDLSVAVRLNGTAGSISGVVDARRSLLVVQSVLQLSSEATLQLHIDGTTRAMGDGLATDYAAIDADQAMLSGTLVLTDHVGYSGPTRGQIDEFQLVTTLFGLSGDFSSVSYNGALLGSDFTYVGVTQGGEDGLFVDLEVSASDVVLRNYLALPGDANGDQVVDVSDFNIWNSHKFETNTSWITGDFNGDGSTDVSDFNIWNSFKFQSVAGGAPLPEPESWLLMLVAASGLASRRR